MPQCAVVGCNSTHRRTKGGSVRYHRFPGDPKTRAHWLKACGKFLNNCSTARICSRHFSDDCYERDVQHEILGLPVRCRLRKGAVPERNLPTDFLKEEKIEESEIAVLLAVGLVPAAHRPGKINGGLPQDLNKMQIMEDVREGCNVQPSSPGHANQVCEVQIKIEENDTPDDEEHSKPTTNEDKETDKEKEEIMKDSCRSQEEIGSEIKEEITEESCSNGSSSQNGEKRKYENDDYPIKKLRGEIHESFYSRDKILNEFIEMADCNSLEQIQQFSEQLLTEVKTLNELAKDKEREWNNIIHLKKLKEELLIRMQRKKQILLINEKSDLTEFFNESQNDNQDVSYTQSILKANLTRSGGRLVNGERLKKNHNSNKQNVDFNGLDLRNRQRPTLDVQSIIADYRQRHPETVPRRGRRIRTNQNSSSSSSVLNFSSTALGSGSQMRHNVQPGDVCNELGMLLNTINGSKVQNDQETSSSNAVSFKDMLQQFAKLSQSERNELIQNAIKPPPPPYPEVTVMPVPSTTSAPTSSLLHGILTKAPSKQNVKTSFSPTLARLLTAPERSSNAQHNATNTSTNSVGIHPSNMSISEILSTSKARNEITITPVEAQYEVMTSTTSKAGTRSAEEDEAEDSVDRLVIDESNEGMDGRKCANTDNGSDNGDEIPQCQGCNQKPAQFVCAGCGNQWYCSRDCQVSAWDEHSEVCSG